MFTNALCLLQAPLAKRPQVLGNCRDGLYFLCTKCLKASNKANTCQICCCFSNNKPLSSSIKNDTCNSFSASPCFPDQFKVLVSNFVPLKCKLSPNNMNVLDDHNSCNVAGDNVDLLWHNRLGHVPFAKMKSITDLLAVFSPKQPFSCNICPMSRQQRLPFNHSNSQTKSIFELLHIDLWGPYHASIYDNYRYFITLVDDYSRSTWTQLLSTKSNALQVLKNFTVMVENQFNTTVKSIRTDNGLEFVNNETHQFLLSKGIIHQKTCPYTPQQNSIVERKHKYLLETAKALLFQSKLPIRYWGNVYLQQHNL